MRIKFLSVIVSFLLMSIAISSCLDSDDTYEASSDATIRAFALDTITKDVSYEFTIDQLKREIYNVDSLPVGSDTIIDRILIKTLTYTGWITTGLQDTLFNIEDSVDLREPIQMKVHAMDGITTREYTIKVNVHKQDPDSLIWRQMQSLPASAIAGKQRSVILENDADEELLYVFTSTKTAYSSSLTAAGRLQWNNIVVNGMPDDAELSTILNFRNNIYVATRSGKVFYSANGADWQDAGIEENGGTQEMKMKTLVATLHKDDLTGITAETLVGILEDGGRKFFCISTDGKNWTRGSEEVDDNFPMTDIYSTLFTNASGIKQIVIVGNTESASNADPTDDTETTDKVTVPWATMNGLEWSDMSTASDLGCKIAVNPSIMYYGGMFYAMGGEFENIYSALVGIAWHEAPDKFKYPMKEIVTPGEGEEEDTVEYESLFKGKGDYSLTIGKNHHIWIVWNDGEVWRGRQNKLGFAEQ